jgi:hypothetical protein
MAKNKISEWSATAANNTDVGGIDIAEGCAPSGINNAIREMMAQIKDQQTGTDADNFTVGGNLIVNGTAAFTSLSLTGNTVIGDAAGDTLTVNATPTFNVVIPVASGGTGTNATPTGTGAYVRAVSPSLTTPALDTPSSGTLTNCTSATQTAGTNNTTLATTAFVQAALQIMFPVGCIYTTTVSTNPNTLFGFGTWVAFGAGRVLIGNGGGFTAGATGGSADAVAVSHSHTATSSSSSSVTDSGHTHNYLKTTRQGASGPLENGGEWDAVQSTVASASATTGISVSTSTSTTVASAGVSGTNANLQPYVVVYMWNRTA